MAHRRKLSQRMDSGRTTLDLTDDYLLEHLEAYAKAHDTSKAAQEYMLGIVRRYNDGDEDVEMDNVVRATREFEQTADQRDREAMALAEALFDTL